MNRNLLAAPDMEMSPSELSLLCSRFSQGATIRAPQTAAEHRTTILSLFDQSQGAGGGAQSVATTKTAARRLLRGTSPSR